MWQTTEPIPTSPLYLACIASYEQHSQTTFGSTFMATASEIENYPRHSPVSVVGLKRHTSHPVLTVRLVHLTRELRQNVTTVCLSKHLLSETRRDNSTAVISIEDVDIHVFNDQRDKTLVAEHTLHTADPAIEAGWTAITVGVTTKS